LVRATRIQAENGWKESRAALHALRAVKDERQRGLRAIVRLVKVYERATGIKVRLELGNLPEHLPDTIERAFQHVVQEGLTNSFRHGHATAVDVLFWLNDREYAVRLRDNGKGSDGYKEGIGFSGIVERLTPLQGSLRAGNVPDGFELHVVIPRDQPEGMESR